MKQLTFFCILFVSLYTNTPAQKNEQDFQVLSYNMALNGLTAGIGAIINNHKDLAWYQRFLKGFSQGCLGGVCIYAGKSMSFEINNRNNYAYCWPSRLMYSMGTSIVENAALNREFCRNWNIDLWVARCDFSLQEHPAFKVRFLLSSIYSIGSMCAIAPDAKFDLHRTAMTGSIIFSSDSLILDTYHGYTIGNTIAIATNSPLYSEHHILAHELIHSYQNREYEVFNTWLEPVIDKVPAKVKLVFDKYLYLDVSYYQLFYLTQGNYDRQYYFKNFYELEAEYFATNQYVPIKRW